MATFRSSRNSRGASKFPGRAPLAICAGVLCATLLASCAEQPVEETETLTALNPDAGPPLPPEAELEEAGSVSPFMDSDFNWEGSLRPDELTPEERIPTIFKRGRIIVGVDQSQNLLSFRDPVTGELRGFEVELAREIARDIFGDPNRVDFRFVDTTDRFRALERGDVDIVIRSVAITSERAKQAEFSTPYFRTQTRLLTMDSSGISGIADLAGQTICVTEGSTALQRARAIAPASPILKTRNWSDCLMALQQHQAQVILGDDAILSGIAAQDPYTHILSLSLSTESYGVAAAPTTADNDSSGLIRQVNSTIERIRSDSTWWTMFNTWFGPYLATYGPPPLQYRSEEGEQNAQAQ
ncbi:glutamate ABC transporter substrate-binding protein [Corynebacterium callunae]|uniref:glutamate ABC transporter substrate-binding protein n=1 Tax=Corynebacterium callunae TaxID=1721 RepID=UPI003981EDB6